MKRSRLYVCLFSLLLTTTLLLGALTAPAQAQRPDLRLDRHSFRPGEEIVVHFVASPHYPANAWVGIIPSHIPHGDEKVNDQHDIAYQYLNKRTKGILRFRAPDKPGGYDFRMHNTDAMGKEICYVGFRVEGKGRKAPAQQYGLFEGAARITLDKQTFKPGEKIRLSFQAPSGLANNAWIGIIPSHIQHGSEAVNDRHDISYQYISGRRNGVMTFTAPRSPGSYDFRMHSSDNNGKEIDYIRFEVRR